MYLEELHTKFLTHREILSNIQNIIPTKCVELEAGELTKTVHALETKWPNDVLGTSEDFEAEIKMWQR